jgi:RNA polymerase sigma factor (sigma-70 family)
LEDEKLITQLLDEKSREQGFRILIEKYQERIYWHVRKMVIDHDDADDLVQDIFVKVYTNITKFRADSQLFTWIYRIATNECLTFLGKKKRRYLFSRLEHNELADKLVSSDFIDGDEIQLKLQRAILTLPDKQRLVFNMKYFDEMKYDDMAVITNTSVGALKASYHYAVKKIEEYVQQ